MTFKLSPIRIIVYFTAFSFIWILTSDLFVSAITKDPRIYTKLSIAKGWLYVIVTAVFLYSLIGSYAKQRMRAEEALKDARDKLEIRVKERTAQVMQQSQLLESFFKHTQTCLVFLDKNFNFVRVNEAYARVCQRDISDFMGHNHFADYPSEELKEEFQRVVDTKEPYNVSGKPFVFPDHPEWGVKYWDLAAAPIVGEDDEVKLLVISLLDVTERTKAEEERRRHRENLETMVIERTAELEKVNRELEAFVYSVSHDLRAPLRSIAGFGQFLMEDYAGKLDERGRDFLSRMSLGAVRMSKLIEDLLSLSRISRQELKKKDLDISKMALSIISYLRASDPSRNVEISIFEGITARGDESLMAIALGNLIANAWKFTSRAADARIEVGTLKRDGKSVYYVRDNGAGFDVQFMEKMFRPFHRLHSGEDFEGTGIGLAIVERVIHRHGGDIWAEGEIVKGATVYFTLEPDVRTNDVLK